MQITFVAKSPAKLRAIPKAVGHPIPARARTANFTGEKNQVADLLGHHRRRLLIGTGPTPDYEAAGALAIARLPYADHLAPDHLALDARALTPLEAARFTAGAILRAWRFDRLKTGPARQRLERLDIITKDPAAAEAAWAPIHAGVQANLFARDLTAEPANILSPQGFAARLARLEREGVQVEILDAARLRTEGLGGLLAVGGASRHPPCLAILRWRGTIDTAPIVLVGKGITFDTGGVDIKPRDHLWDMKADMAGAAACAGAMLAMALRRAPTPAIAVLALAENAIGSAAYRPSDVLTLCDGRTVEVVDTDAEGRLVLADALAWAAKHLRPAALIDVATLTGAVITALGHAQAGIFGTSEPLIAQLRTAGLAVHEPLWPLPIAPGHKDALDSDIADLRHCEPGRGTPDACIAAAFLREFVGDTPWAHLDIAGMELRPDPPHADPDRHPPGATGFGARLLDRFMQDRDG